MGYAVYDDRRAMRLGVERWAGYGVPAVCDMPGCETEIDRGLGYVCGERPDRSSASETRDDGDWGCGLYFCGDHRFLVYCEHGKLTPKPDTAEWETHMLTDESWQDWRDKNPEKVEAMKRRTDSSG